MALGLGADVTVLDRDAAALESLASRFGPAVRTLYSTPRTLAQLVPTADLVIGAVLLPGARTPRLITTTMVKQMRPGSVIVDVAIDQGGCAETSRPTTHADPTYIVDGVVHYCVTNMPGAVPRTSTQALNNVTLPYVLKLADSGTGRSHPIRPGPAERHEREARSHHRACRGRRSGLPLHTAAGDARLNPSPRPPGMPAVRPSSPTVG